MPNALRSLLRRLLRPVLRPLVCGLALACLAASSAAAQLQRFTDRASWAAALSSRRDLGLAGIAPDGGVAPYSFTGLYGAPQFLDLGGVLFTAPFMFVIDDDYFTPGLRVGREATLSPQNAVVDPADETGLLLVLFPRPVTAFGIDYFNRPGRGHFILAGVDGGAATDLFVATEPNWNFLGYTAATPFSSIYLYSAATPGSVGHNIAYDRPSYGTASVVPEPAPLALCAVGLALPAVAAARRRRRA